MTSRHLFDAKGIGKGPRWLQGCWDHPHRGQPRPGHWRRIMEQWRQWQQWCKYCNVDPWWSHFDSPHCQTERTTGHGMPCKLASHGAIECKINAMNAIGANHWKSTNHPCVCKLLLDGSCQRWSFDHILPEQNNEQASLPFRANMGQTDPSFKTSILKDPEGSLIHLHFDPSEQRNMRNHEKLWLWNPSQERTLPTKSAPTSAAWMAAVRWKRLCKKKHSSTVPHNLKHL